MAEYTTKRAVIATIVNNPSKVAIEASEYGNHDRNSTLQFLADRQFEIIDLIDTIPAADVAPVRHGKWFLLDECANEGVYCSVCAKKVYKTDYANQKIKSKYCPNCGAKMDGDKR